MTRPAHGRDRGEIRSAVPRRIPDGLKSLLAGLTTTNYIVYRGDAELEVKGTRVLPLEAFLRRLYGGEIIG